MRVNSCRPRTPNIIIVLAILLAMPCVDRAFASAQSNLPNAASIRREACRDLQSSCDHLVAAHANDPAVAGFLRRLAVLDAAADDIFHDLQVHRSEYFDHSLATIDGTGSERDESSVLLGAANIVEKHAGAFAQAHSSSDLQGADRQMMDRYLSAAIESLATAVQSRAGACMTLAGSKSAEILRLAFVLPVLTNDPNQSLAEPAPPLPAWMIRASALGVLRGFAVESSRPRLAFALTRTSTTTTAPADLSADYVSFVTQQADAMSRTAKYSAVLAALRDGISVASAVHDQPTVTKLSFRLAEVLERSASAKAAADEIQSIRSLCPDPADYARASVLHLKYLYAAGQYSAMVADASADLNQPRCQSALRQIIYITWATCRKHGMDAAPWSEIFIERFPDDPLAAQIYLASAIDAIAQGKNPEASRLLDFIEYRFPQSKIIPQVRQVRARLRAVDPTSEPAAETNGSQQ